MSSLRPGARRLLLLCLIAALGATASASWHFAREAKDLRATANTLRAEQASRQAAARELDARRQALLDQLASARAARPEAGRPAPPAALATAGVSNIDIRASAPRGGAVAAPRLTADGRLPPPSGSQGNVYFPQLFGDPHYAQLYLAWQEFNLRQRYAALFADLASAQVPTDEITRLREMLARRAMANEEVDGILDNQALAEKKTTDRLAAAQIKSQVRRTLDRELEESFSPEIVAKLRDFDYGINARQQFVDRLAARLSYSPTPLSHAQARQIEVLHRSTPSREARTGPQPVLSDEFMARAPSVLEPGQMTALEEIRAELDAARVGATSSIRGQPVPRSGPPPSSPPR